MSKTTKILKADFGKEESIRLTDRDKKHPVFITQEENDRLEELAKEKEISTHEVAYPIKKLGEGYLNKVIGLYNKFGYNTVEITNTALELVRRPKRKTQKSDINSNLKNITKSLKKISKASYLFKDLTLSLEEVVFAYSKRLTGKEAYQAHAISKEYNIDFKEIVSLTVEKDSYFAWQTAKFTRYKKELRNNSEVASLYVRQLRDEMTAKECHQVSLSDQFILGKDQNFAKNMSIGPVESEYPVISLSDLDEKKQKAVANELYGTTPSYDMSLGDKEEGSQYFTSYDQDHPQR